ncbi:hypothetical protein [Mycobacterium sp.]|uniref:hypothetical protein n=1 Tax=Mycobacterium sp. TaxID=1785 RepID=UPI003BB10224
MSRPTRGLILAASACSAFALLIPPATAQAHSPRPAAAARPGDREVAGQVVAYRGKGGAVFANKPGSSTFTRLGNTIVGAPAVAWANRQFFFVAATHHGLEVRTFTSHWSQLVKGGFRCSQPDLASDGKRLGLSCLHDHALYAAKFAAPRHGVPSLATLHLQGGKNLIHGAGAYFQGRQFAFEVIGEVYEDDARTWNSHYGAYGKPLYGGDGQDGDDSFYCRAQATGASAPKHGRVYTGCAVKRKKGYVLSIVTEATGVCPVTPTTPIAAARVGIAPTAKNAAVAVYETPSGSIAETSMTIHPPAIDCGRDAGHVTVIAKGATSGPSIALGANGYR